MKLPLFLALGIVFGMSGMQRPFAIVKDATPQEMHDEIARVQWDMQMLERFMAQIDTLCYAHHRLNAAQVQKMSKKILCMRALYPTHQALTEFLARLARDVSTAYDRAAQQGFFANESGNALAVTCAATRTAIDALIPRVRIFHLRMNHVYRVLHEVS